MKTSAEERASLPRLAAILRLACGISILASALFFGLAAVDLNRASEAVAPEESLQVEPGVKDLGELAPGLKVPVEFTAINRSSRTVSLLGVNQYCTTWGCFYGKTGDFPVTIPVGASRTVTLRVDTRPQGFSGDFAGEVVLYSDVPGCEQTQLRIYGKVALAEGS